VESSGEDAGCATFWRWLVDLELEFFEVQILDEVRNGEVEHISRLDRFTEETTFPRAGGDDRNLTDLEAVRVYTGECKGAKK